MSRRSNTRPGMRSCRHSSITPSAAVAVMAVNAIERTRRSSRLRSASALQISRRDGGGHRLFVSEENQCAVACRARLLTGNWLYCTASPACHSICVVAGSRPILVRGFTAQLVDQHRNRRCLDIGSVDSGECCREFRWTIATGRLCGNKPVPFEAVDCDSCANMNRTYIEIGQDASPIDSPRTRKYPARNHINTRTIP